MPKGMGKNITTTSARRPSRIRIIPEGNLEQAVLGQLAALFRAPAILRATLAAVRSKEELLRRDFERDCEILQNQLKELKKASLEKETDYEEIKKVASELAEVKRKKSLLRDVVSEETCAKLQENGLKSL